MELHALSPVYNLLPDKGQTRRPSFKLQPPAPSERIGELGADFGNVAQGGWGEWKAVRVGPVIEFKTEASGFLSGGIVLGSSGDAGAIHFRSGNQEN